MILTFRGCKHLDYSDKYLNTCELVFGLDGKPFWKRCAVPYGDAPRLVQFCKRRGRLNDPRACLSTDQARCGDYEEITHVTPEHGQYLCEEES